ncbi:MAG: GFA family protein, partial [Pseudomonadota bacterium]
MTTRTATCTCGQLRITVSGPPIGTGLCHCLACQSRTGSAFATLAVFAEPYTVEGKATEYVRTGDAGAAFRFRFCPVCGSTVYHTEEGTSGSVAVAVGCLGDPNFPAPEASVYDSRRHHWVTLPDKTETFEKD